ncbi:hypothetical protein CK222_18815 [Mesorhizobium sp. WSM3866]|nr:hypothetical protein CK222_18815 [Mesorhizobium sp. WSM3866]
MAAARRADLPDNLLLMPADPGSFLRSRKFAEPAMKKTYEKPRLVKKGRLSAVTANGATSLTF